MTNETLRKVPELSLLSYVNGDQNDQLRFVDNFFAGLKNYGFIILTDHTIDQSKVDTAYDYLHEFFNLSTDQKLQYDGKSNGGQRGYTAFGREHAKDCDSPDLKEFWHVGREISSDHNFSKYYPSNCWPKEIEGFKQVMLELYNAMDATSIILLDALSKALDLPSGYFTAMIKDGNSILRAIHYPPVAGHDTQNSVRAAAHGDINLITMLVGATDSGLQLLERDGTWLDVNSSPGQIVVDTGDMMSRITNDVLPSTIHRVVNPDDTGSTRYSMPFFVHPHPEAMLSCIPSCVGKGAKYKDISSHDFLMERLKQIGLY